MKGLEQQIRRREHVLTSVFRHTLAIDGAWVVNVYRRDRIVAWRDLQRYLLHVYDGVAFYRWADDATALQDALVTLHRNGYKVAHVVDLDTGLEVKYALTVTIEEA